MSAFILQQILAKRPAYARVPAAPRWKNKYSLAYLLAMTYRILLKQHIHFMARFIRVHPKRY
jgi:hypothetical protein